MKLMITILLFLGILAVGSTLGQTAEGDCITENFEFFTYSITEDNLEASTALYAYNEQRGCCSWHGGVCGCSGGRKECCDGTLSPSCTCHHDDGFEVYYQ